ncbi:MAG TPA: RICIN domain-containing protein, partial [Phycisphaerae bacterium]|nr:RICIN domain-containing protein [Phycisphaerae bacterium]
MLFSPLQKNRQVIRRNKKSPRNLLLRPVIEALEPRLMLSSLTPGYTYALVNSNSNLAADVPSGMNITGIVVVQYNWSGRNEQEWKMTSLGSGHYEIINAASGEALGVTGAATTSGATVDQETYVGNTSQQWTLTSVGSSGAFLITNVNSGLNLDVTSTSAYGGYGAQLIQNAASGSASQDWQLKALAPGWTDQDIGSPGVAGSADYTAIYNGTTWNVTGGGLGTSTSDQFNFVSQSFTGNAEIYAEVTSQTDSNASAKAGLMFRNTNAANSAFADVVVTPSDGVEFQWRSTAGGSYSSASVSGIKASVWLELVRNGNQFSGYYSTNDETWTQIGSTQTITMNSTVLAGMAVTAQNNSTSSTAGFSWVNLGNQPVYVNSSGQLAYNALPNGDQVMDFSTAGYEEGNMPIPTNIPVEATVDPSGDTTGSTDTTNIQDAINTVSALPLVDGIRGAVLLEPGEFYVSGTLNITASGVVLEGSGESGSSSGGTSIQMINDVQNLIEVSGGSLSGVSGTKENITESYVPTGTDTLTVASTAPYQVGDQIEIVDEITAAFIQYMGMDELYRNGAQQTWISAGSNLITERTITAIDGNQITLDAPMSTSINANLQPGAYVEECTSGAISQVGIQNMQLLAAAQEPTDSAGDAAININGLTDGWVQDMNMVNMISDVGVGGNCSKITVQNIISNHTGEVSGDSLPADFSVGDGPTTQILFNNITDNGDKIWFFTTYDLTAGPIVVENSTFTGTGGALEPHMRWSTGLLIDDVSVPDSGIDIFNRETDGSGHGWTIGSGVVWNSSATSLTVQNPPGTEVWVVGSTGTEGTTGGPVQPPGIIYSQGVPISSIPSLYEAQLAQRLAENALPTGWTAQDIGGPEAIGDSSYNHSTGVWTVTGDGTDINNTVVDGQTIYDQFQFASEAAGSYATISAEVDSVQDVNASTKAGVMFRNSNAADDVFADVVVKPDGGGVEFEWRSTVGGSVSSASASPSGINAPVWVKLVRSGSSFSAYYSTNDSTWIQIGSTQTITMSDVVLAGLAVTSHDNGALATGTFSDVSVVNEVMNETLSGATISQNEAFFSGSTLTIENGLTIDSGVTVSIEPGAVIDFTGSQTLSGAGDIDLNGGQFEVGASDTLTIDSGTTISGAGYISGNLNIAGNVTISGLVSDSGNVAIGSGDTLTVNPTANTLFSGIVSGAGNLTVGGGSGSSLILTGANTYSGATTINSGATLQIGNGGTSGNLGTAPITDNGTLAFDLSSPLTVSNIISGTGGLLDSGTGVITLPVADTYKGLTTINSGSTLDVSGSIVGPVDDNGTLNFENTLDITDLNGSGSINLTSGDTLTVVPTMMDTYSGVISGAAGLTIGGTTGSSLTLNGANTYTGATTINNGATLEVGNGSNNTAFLGTSPITDDGNLITDLTAGGPVWTNTISGDGTLTLNSPSSNANFETSGNASNFTGVIIINSGVRYWINAAAAIPDASSTTINSGGQLWVDGSWTYGGTITIYPSGPGVAWAGDTDVFGAIRLNGSTLSGTINLDNTALISAQGGSQTISGQITGAGALEIAAESTTVGADPISLTNAADNWTGGTDIFSGALKTTVNMAANPLGNVSFGSATTGYAQESAPLSGELNLDGTSQTLTGLTVAGGTADTITSSAAGGNLTFASGTSTFSGLISGGADLALALASGSLTLTDANTFSGGTTISGGTLEVSDTADNGSTSLGGGNVIVKTGGILIGADQDAFGYGSAAPQTITINGGTVTDLGTSDYRITLPNLIFINGGTLTSATGNTGDAYGNYSLNGEGGTATVTIDAAASTATISAAQISFEQPTTFDVVGGAGSIGVTSGGVTPDLLVTSNIVPYGSNSFTKTGSGLMKLTGDSTSTATPNPVTGTTTNLSVQGTDIDGQNNGTLIYTWSVTSMPNGAATPTFSVNGTNAAQNTTATFSQAGAYTFLATVTDNAGVSSTSSVSVTVDLTLTSITVSPSDPSVNVNSTQQFSAVADDQFGNAMTTQPTFTWSVTSGGGSINSSGLYTAPGSGGYATVQAASGSVTGNTNVTIINPTPPTLVSVVSYKQQGDGSYGITLGMGDTPTVEDRIDGPTDMVLTFNTS